jgi:nickel/cobalt exporter
MNETTLLILIGSAISIGFVHTLVGPDHYLPFILLAKARSWRLGKILWITFGCGVGHVLGSVLIGSIGIAAGIAVGRLEVMEGVRGGLASWLLIGFGLVYGIWGLRRGLKGKTHVHPHVHGNGSMHSHTHSHMGDHSHVHDERGKVTPWILFIIFVLGPCEPLIPLLMYPAAQGSWLSVVLVTLAFGFVTVGTMMTIVGLSTYGLLHLRLGYMENYVHAIAGGIIVLSGLSIKFLGL